MANIPQLVQYLRQCYEADNRETGISNLFNTKYRHLRFFEGEEVALSGTLQRVPLPGEYGEKVRKDAFKYRRDKTLVYAAFPIVGKSHDLQQFGGQLCAPLVYFSCTLNELKGSLFLEPDLSEVRVNFPVLAALAAKAGVDESEFIDACSQLPPLPWPRDQVHSVAAMFAHVLHEVDFTALSRFPNLLAAEQVREAQGETHLKCLPACAGALLPNSPDTRGVLFELNEIAAQQQHAPPVRAILSGQSISASSQRARPCLAPSVLSDAQQKVVRACRSQAVTLVIGPPGTGKSHTIASVALDHLALNQSVLIASRMDQAVNVVGDKLQQLVGENHAVVRAGRKEHLRELKKLLENMLAGIGHPQTKPVKNSRSLFRSLRSIDKQLLGAELSFRKNQNREIAWGELATAKDGGLLAGVTRGMLKRLRDWQLSDFDGWAAMERYEQMLEDRSQLSQDFLQQSLTERTSQLLGSRREDLSKFLQAIRARSDGKQQKLFQEIDFSVLLRAFPIWLCKLSDLSNVLPLQTELFDLAILDEATQCDIASCIPLLQRARRVAIVGDPKQLRHISFLAESRQSAIADECGLTAQQQERFHFRRRSILDATNDSIKDQQQVVFLNEHFRSLPQIIEFSNREFYGNSLSVMRQRPYAAPPTAVAIRPVRGQRASSGKNAVEANAIVEDIAAQIKRQAKATPAARQTLGVLSPFRDQVDLLSRKLNKSLSFEQMEAHDLLIGTAHTFQGEERDIMYLSLAIDDDAHWASFRFLENPNVLNVAITRARHLQFAYCSFTIEKLPQDSLLRRWLATLQRPLQLPVGKLKTMDAFRNAIVLALEPFGYSTWKDYPIAGLEIDLIVESKRRAIGIDLVGYPGAMAEAFEIERYRMLHRAGLRLLPLSYRAWQEDPQKCINRIAQALEIAT